MNATLQVLVALAAGVAAGLLISASAHPVAQDLPGILAPIGTVFINAIRMTVVPLVVSKLIVGVASRAGDASIARLGGAAVAWFATLLMLAASFSALIAAPLFAALPLDAAVVGAMRQAAPALQATPPAVPSLRGWLEGLVSPNVVSSAADAALLPLIVFAVMLGLALGQVAAEPRQAVVRFFEGLGDAMLVIVRWVLRLAPLGVFALTVPVVARLGTAAAGALAAYVATVGGVTAMFALLVLYPLGSVVGRVPIAAFAREIAPAQAIAFSSRSSLASLPVMMDQAARLGLPAPVVGFFLPLAASMFRVGSVMGTTIGALFIARLYGVTLEVAQVATVVATAVLVAVGSPGVPSGSILVIVPILASIGLPAEGVGILLGVDPIPDMFRTTTNITGNMAVACALSRDDRTGPSPAGHGAT